MSKRILQMGNESVQGKKITEDVQLKVISWERLSSQALEDKTNVSEKAIKGGNEPQHQHDRLADLQTALDVLLEKLQHQEVAFEEKILLNVEQTILPYIKKIKKTQLDANQKSILEIIEKNLHGITSSFSGNLSSKLFGCTATEIQVANLVKLGQTTKEIAAEMNLSPKTISTHRDSIRKKLGIQNKKINLRSFLMNQF